jgi:hypothetical protein
MLISLSADGKNIDLYETQYKARPGMLWQRLAGGSERVRPTKKKKQREKGEKERDA